ncbi:hypothetical protein [Perlucidibaca piscinae]|jgi:hypothetical protein|uniref:hypothetical protein n=1 Tax=Perlucidibaca piscinae TaxID=392589 RepID=UPI000418C86E|nr:hypothetical protein [Perlucidibaca piscinae]
MKRIHRQRLSLFMSLVLAIFTICQAQVMAAVGPTPAETSMSAMPDCHEAGDKTSTTETDCTTVCQHLSGHPDFAKQATSVDASPLLLAFLQPFELSDAEYISSSSYRPPDPSVIDPPPSIRFQRFLN